jgi:protein-histidine pros-kinase
VEVTLEPVACQSVIEEVVATLRPAAERKGLEFVVRVPSAEVVVHADRRALSQILLNLTSNAIKFTDHGTVQLALSLREEGERRMVEVSVVDTGVGISPTDQAKLFQSFMQVDGSTRRRAEGTGLGLYLSRKLAELLNGQIICQSEYGKGSTFALLLQEDERAWLKTCL